MRASLAPIFFLSTQRGNEWPSRCEGKKGISEAASLVPELQRQIPPANGGTMIGQKTLLSFFTAAPGKKRSRSPESGGNAELMAFVAEERKHSLVYPPPHQVFTWTQMCNIHDVKVVILGQDPYHGPNQAHGLCFSVQRPVPPPPSLENIYKELATDIEGFSHPGHGDLTGWAKQGVLLLNAVLTVRAHQANSHKEKGWEQFTDAVVSWLNKNLDGLVFMLWGAYAQKKGSSIDRKRHHILQTVHPSPLSVHRGFFGCKHFSKTNELLEKSGKKPIDWRAL
ncbi:uracil-DNA glycosylase isoform X2 [Rhineura floridana]|uniref:uracil-DNA glycosylase isoform X2 n=1 Tax=Rhineura floridana TaxID=261503 RepID=UPI002AC89166|nr:uracil-DNA glycosylase isoform X2 [Rhineura floridana]